MKRKAPRISKISKASEFSLKFADLGVSVKSHKSISVLRKEATKTLAALVADRVKYQALIEEYSLDGDDDGDEDEDQDEEEELPARFFKRKPKKSDSESWKAYM